MARDEARLRGDHAGVGPDPEMAGRLHRLSESNHYRIAGGEPDIRGWEVRTLSGNHLGEVEDLLIDPARGEVVMLDVDLNDSRERVNLPIRSVQLDRDRKYVIADSGDISNVRSAVQHEHLHNEVDAHDTDARAQDIRYGQSRQVGENTEETVIERRPVIEEVVVRRRVVDEE